MSLTLTLSNIGTVKNANVNIRGLTAIAGYNGTGKSTIGKILFSCIGGVKSLLNRESGIVSENLDRYVWFVDSSIRILSNILNTISKNEDINLLPFKDTSYIKAYINSEDNSLVVDGNQPSTNIDIDQIKAKIYQTIKYLINNYFSLSQKKKIFLLSISEHKQPKKVGKTINIYFDKFGKYLLSKKLSIFNNRIYNFEIELVQYNVFSKVIFCSDVDSFLRK